MILIEMSPSNIRTESGLRSGIVKNNKAKLKNGGRLSKTGKDPPESHSAPFVVVFIRTR
jgi:hypothetical protein